MRQISLFPPRPAPTTPSHASILVPVKRPNKTLINFSGLLRLSAPTLSLFGLDVHASPREVRMSLTVFMALCILSCDFLLYVLFQWIYGEKHRKHPRRSAESREKRQTLVSNQVREHRVISFPQRSTNYRSGFF
jgi:hypothetical protein